jgi:hypothetical protein
MWGAGPATYMSIVLLLLLVAQDLQPLAVAGRHQGPGGDAVFNALDNFVLATVQEDAIRGADVGRLAVAVTTHDAGTLKATLRHLHNMVGFLCENTKGYVRADSGRITVRRSPSKRATRE